MGRDLRACISRDPDMADDGMTKYLISFPSEAMMVTDEELPEVSAAAHAVIEEAKAAGVYVFGGGIDEQVEPVLVSSEGLVSTQIYPGSRIKGGFAVLELPTRREAVEWARKIAVACRCSQELREFMYDPAS
ncbi:YciI family protein [Sphingopyxis sp. JAI108]|uniref:YciI family protein n=1 Tax=Sphingopyxis sp. JAI108 TaxID=2723060 RepID=UPI00211BC161|nr:transcription initiation protein [Sphingopyxis sp. JAI108]